MSSSAHLVIVPWLLNWSDSVLNQLTFHVSLHLGTLVALLAFFAEDWLRLLRAGVSSVVERRIGSDPDRRLAWFLVIGTIPTGVAGLLAESYIDALFHSTEPSARRNGLLAMAGLLVVGGLALWAADAWGRKRRRLDQITLVDVLVIGLAQVVSLLPGVSRSGSTIMAGMALRFERPAAARFSFLLSAPIVCAVGLKGLYNMFQQFSAGKLSPAELELFGVGLLASMVSGFFCIKFLLRFLQNNSTAVFALYRCLLAVAILWIAFRRG